MKWAQHTTHLDGAVVLAYRVVELDADAGLAILGVKPDESDDTVTLALHGNPIANGDVESPKLRRTWKHSYRAVHLLNVRDWYVRQLAACVYVPRRRGQLTALHAPVPAQIQAPQA